MNILLSLLIFFPLTASVGSLLIKKESHGRMYALIISAAEFILSVYAALNLNGGEYILNGVLAGSFNLKLNSLSSVYIIIISAAWVVSAVVSLEYMHHYKNTKLYYFCYLVTLAMTVGVFLSADFMSAFVCFEVMSFSSFVWVIFEENDSSVYAAKTYLGVAILGSMLMFLGMGIIHTVFGTLEFDALRSLETIPKDKAYVFAAGVMIMLGYGAKAAVFPLHIWLPKAHPVAPAPASALLSGLLTKVGIFGIIAVCSSLFYGDIPFGIVLWVLALITMFVGAFLAVMSDNFKRTLACSSMSQIGFILMGISCYVILGEEASVAVTGTVGYMMNHSVFKCLLFSVAAVIYMNTHKLNLNEIKGFGKNKPLLKTVFLIGCLGIGAIPLFSGYISKTLIHEALLECAHHLPEGVVSASEVIFMISGGCTIAYMSKLFYCVFVEKNEDSGIQAKYDAMKKYMAVPTATVLLIICGVIIFFGSGERLIHAMNTASGFFGVEELHHIPHFFSLHELSGALKSVIIASCVYFIVVRKITVKNGKYVNPFTFDLQDNVYMPVIEKTVNISYAVLSVFGENKITKPVAKGIMNGSYGILSAFGENKLIVPLSKGVMKVYECISAVLCASVDAVIYMFNHLTFFGKHRHKNFHIGNSLSDTVGTFLDRITRQDKFQIYFADMERNFTKIWNGITNSFSFALLMTCLGLSIVLLFVIFI